MSTYERCILQKLKELHGYTCQPVRTVMVADHLGKYDRTIRKYLVQLEMRGMVTRKGQRGGWMPAKQVWPVRL